MSRFQRKGRQMPGRGIGYTKTGHAEHRHGLPASQPRPVWCKRISKTNDSDKELREGWARGAEGTDLFQIQRREPQALG